MVDFGFRWIRASTEMVPVGAAIKNEVDKAGDVLKVFTDPVGVATARSWNAAGFPTAVVSFGVELDVFPISGSRTRTTRRSSR